MDKLILLLIFLLFSHCISGQEKYLLLTRERHIGTSPTTLAELPVAIAIDNIAEKLPAPPPVERKIREGALVKVVSSGTSGREKTKGRLDILNDSAISVGSGTILINDINKIFVRSVFSKVSGPVITCAGVAGAIITTPWFIESLALFNGGVLQVLGAFVLVPLAAAAVVGCTFAIVGGIIYFINGRIYNTSDNWYTGRHRWKIYVSGYHSGSPPG